MTFQHKNLPKAALAAARIWETLAHNVGWALTGNVAYAGCQWGMLSAIAKLLSAEAVGSFALALAITAPILILSQLQLRSVQATDVRSSIPFSAYLGIRLVMTISAVVVVSLACYLSHYDMTTRRIVLTVACAKGVESISDCIYGLLQQHLRMRSLGISLILKGTVSVVVFSACIASTRSLAIGGVGLLVSWTAVLLLYDIPVAADVLRCVTAGGSNAPNRYSQLIPTFQPSVAGKIMRECVPLGVASMLYTLAPNVPRFFLEKSAGRHALGIYSALAYILVAGTVVINAIGTAAVPVLARQYAARQFKSYAATLGSLSLIAVGLGAALLVIGIVCGGPLLRHLYGPEYAQFADAFCWIMAAGCVTYCASILGYGIVATRRFSVQVPLHIVVTSAIAGSCLIAIPKYGIIGAAWSVMLGGALASVLTVAVIVQGITSSELEQAALMPSAA